jgi:hypothetical protein
VKGQTLWTRVWNKADIKPGACWNWQGAKSQKRRRGCRQMYRPVIQLAGRGSKVVNVARLVTEWFQGPAPNSTYEAGHTCPEGENELCINPDHLIWMTREENERYKHEHRPVESVRASAEVDDQTRSVRVDHAAEHHHGQPAEGAADEAGPFN